MSSAGNIFSDLKVVDLASYIAGPAATTILSDFGATVVKVEPPGRGDPYRYFYATPPNPVCERNYAWQLTNRNKRSIALDLKSPAAREVLIRLARWADVLVTNYPPKVRKGLGLTYEEIAPLNPRLIYADITGYGSVGPEADKPGFDVTAYWARTGLMQVTHDEDSPPTLPIPGITQSFGALMSANATARKPAPALPAPDSDFYLVAEHLSDSERALLTKVRTFMETKVAPVINKFWAEDAFPFELLPGIAELNIAGVGFEGYGCPGGSTLLDGFIAMEMARVDASIATFYGVHSGLAMGSIYLGGSEEQKQKWLPPMARLEKIGCFGLTEPLVGSGAGGGLLTTARREGDEWVLNGQKRWIGNSPWCDLSIIWARDEADNQVKGFIVENKTAPGFSVQKIERKVALRVVQNGVITLDNCRVPEENRLQGDNSFRDTSRVLRLTRQYVAWEAVGCSMGAYEHALAYAQKREQFGKPIASFQLVQDLLSRMIGNITASQCMVVRLAQLQDQGKLKDQHASLAKAFCTTRMRETVAWAREVCGGNGIVLDYNVARFFADSEALYSYEGTREMNSLIVGKAITGFSAFVS